MCDFRGILKPAQRHTPRPKKGKIPFWPVSGGSKTNGKAPCPRAAVRAQALTAVLSCPKYPGDSTPQGRKKRKTGAKNRPAAHIAPPYPSRSPPPRDTPGAGKPHSGPQTARVRLAAWTGVCLSPRPETGHRKRPGQLFQAAPVLPMMLPCQFRKELRRLQ